MNIDEIKNEREKYQSKNLLSIIGKEIFPKKYTIAKRNDRPDIILKIENKTIGIEITECCHSNYKDDNIENKDEQPKKDKPLYRLKTYNWLKRECETFINNPYFVSLTKDQCYKIKIYNTNAVYHGNHHDDFQKELIEHIEAIRFKRYPIRTKLIHSIKIEPCIFNHVDFFHTSCPALVKWKDILREIEKKERQSQAYEHTDELWLNIYIPWEENIISYEIDIEHNDLDTVRERLKQSRFQRIYLSSFREQDTFVLKTNNGEDMLDEEHCFSNVK